VKERRFASALIVALVVINQLQVAINIRLSFFNRDWFNAIQNRTRPCSGRCYLSVLLLGSDRGRQQFG